MLQILERSVAESEVPNPSVLLAFNLAGATGSNARQQLLKEIKEDAVNRAQKGRGEPRGAALHPTTPAGTGAVGPAVFSLPVAARPL